MRRSISLGALSVLLSGSALVPAMADAARASSRDAGGAVDSASRLSAALAAAAPATRVAIREADQPLEQQSEVLAPAALPFATAPALGAPVNSAPAVQVASTYHGQASWYGPGFYGGRTANGEVFRRGTMTAAHRSLPFGTRVRVTNLWNGRSAVVRINDRGPFHGGRIIDLAHGAAQELGVASSGVASVKLEVLR